MQKVSKAMFIKKITGKLAVLALVLCIILSGCQKKDDANLDANAGALPSEGGVLNLASYSPDTLNPLTTQYSCVRDFLHLAYEGLFIVNEDLTVKNVLASGYKITENNTVFRIELKKDVKFHDGSAFNSDDVIATFEYIQSYDNPYSDVFDNVKGYNAEGDHAVVITLNSPGALFLNNLDFPILPSGLKAKDFEAPNYAFTMNGTGRYMYHKTNPYESMVLQKNPHWHGDTKVYIPQVCIRYVKDNDAILYAFDAGETDLITTERGRWGEYSHTGNYETYEVTTTKYSFIGINTASSAFADVELRRSVAALFDKEFIADSLMFSHASPADTPLSAKGSYYRSDDDDKKATPSELKSKRLSVYMLYNEESVRKEEMALYAKTILEEAGVKVKLTKVDFETYCRKIETGDYQLYVGEVDMRRDCDLSFMFDRAPQTAAPNAEDMVVKVDDKDTSADTESGDEADIPDEIHEPVPTAQISAICDYTDSKLDDIISNINSAKDTEAMKVAYNNLRIFFKENVPQIPLYHMNEAMFVNTRVKGKIKPNLTNLYADIGEIYIEVK